MDTSLFQLRLPYEKLTRLKAELAKCIHRRSVSKRELQSLPCHAIKCQHTSYRLPLHLKKVHISHHHTHNPDGPISHMNVKNLDRAVLHYYSAALTPATQKNIHCSKEALPTILQRFFSVVPPHIRKPTLLFCGLSRETGSGSLNY